MSLSGKWAKITKLTEGNYLRWKRQVLINLEASDMLAVADGSVTAPAEDADTNAACRRKTLKLKL